MTGAADLLCQETMMILTRNVLLSGSDSPFECLIYLDKGSEVILDCDWVVSRASRGQSVTRDSVTERDTASLPRY